jgi:hypothetical protein
VPIRFTAVNRGWFCVVCYCASHGMHNEIRSVRQWIENVSRGRRIGISWGVVYRGKPRQRIGGDTQRKCAKQIEVRLVPPVCSRIGTTLRQAFMQLVRPDGGRRKIGLPR